MIAHPAEEVIVAFIDPLYGRHVTYRSLHPVLERAGLLRIRFHDLRHTAATLMLAGGVPVKAVSKMLRHFNTAITQDVHARPAHDASGGRQEA